jgi:hypothetical protein
MASLLRVLLVCLAAAVSTAWALPAPAPAAGGESSGAAALKSRYADLRAQFERSAFGRPIVLQSSEAGRTQKGEVYAVVDYPFSVVERGLSESQNWCDVMILPYNTKHCHADGSGRSSTLTLRIGRKADQSPEDAHPIKFNYNVEATSADHLRVVLDAPEGPLGTRDYRIVLEATPIDEKHSFVHLGYSYGFSTLSKFAMQAYLNTAGANKVGFTEVGRDREGKPQYVGGMLGATERNTMRYFLAIDAFLGSLAVPQSQRLEKRLGDWYAAAHKYPRQLSEMEFPEYLAMKRREAGRMKEAL